MDLLEGYGAPGYVYTRWREGGGEGGDGGNGSV